LAVGHEKMDITKIFGLLKSFVRWRNQRFWQYVGEIKDFGNAKTVVIFKDICNLT
jgi:hypothetical protein